jgi:type I restriction-modification system DNA methylase subunit
MSLFDPLQPEFSEDGHIIDFITDDLLADRPEERVRQRLQRLLHIEYGYPKNRIAREIPIYYGRKEVKGKDGKPIRADVAVFRSASAAKKKDQGQIEIVCETKQPKREEGYSQLVSYVFNTSTDGAVWYNGEDIRTWRRVENELPEWPTLPRSGEAWDAVGRRKKSELIELKDPKGTLRRCHDRIHSRGVTDDIAITMVRLLLAKWRDEERPGEYTEFYCTPEEFQSKEGREAVAKRVGELFIEVREENPTVFDPHEQINASPDEIVEVVTELQHYRLLGENDEQWDMMGMAYEEYTKDEMKREGGEFFTNRLIVKLLTQMVITDSSKLSNITMLDLAGGTGGFCTAIWRQIRQLIRKNVSGRAAQEAAIDNLKNHIFLIDKKTRLVKLARCAMILTKNGHRGFIQGDSLQPIHTLPPDFLKQCQEGKVSLLMTNPPWSGLTNGRQTDPLLLANYEVAKRWAWDDTGNYLPTEELISGGIPPEYLFVEQSIKWLAPEGILAIVLPKGILDNMEPALAVRHYLFRHCKVLAVINCNKFTFQPYTGSRGCLIVTQKKKQPDNARNYKIFMAINRKIGQDSEGEPVYIKDEQGKPTPQLDHDLNSILEAWNDFQRGHLKDSEYTFTINAKDIDDRTLKLNPQYYLPALNKTLKRIVALDGNGFSIERLGDRIASRIWKGSRWKREDLVVDLPTADTIDYITPTSIFMRGQGVKHLDLSRCPEKRKAEILKHIACVGEILITRSGTIGRVYIVGRSLEGKILSDDLIRVRIADQQLRAFVFAFLRNPGGQNQLLRNEYGTVQQHLEPGHVADLLLPLPDDEEGRKNLMNVVKKALAAREKSVERETEADEMLWKLIRWDEE